MASIILPPGSAPASPSEGEIYYDNTTKQVKVKDASSFKALADVNSEVEPHIITKKLHPAYLGKLLDDTTSHAGAYGTEQSDGRMYYYTDIAGSKPIKDPRIGAHFGSQRYDIRSLQLLEQETATHGNNIYSVDGREYLRAASSSGNWYVLNNDKGNYIQNDVSNGDFIEIVAYGNQLNMSYIWTANASHSVNRFDVYVDGVLKHDSPASALATVDRPGMTRYVNGASVFNLVDAADNVSCGLHTFKMLVAPAHQGNTYVSVSNIEIIAQDTTSSSTKVKIQVPAQDVVSYGRKFSVSATAQHYDPFNGFSSGNATALATKVDTATSLGLAKWLHSGSYYRPYNGMRVVKWIDENGAIKTSVTCMPPNAKSIADSSSLTNANAKANASIANNTFYPTFEAHTTAVNEDNLHELAKTFHWREFGNGAANTGGGGNWADASMLSANDDIAYVMDDGLTGISADDVDPLTSPANALNLGPTDGVSITFIGTGISVFSPNWAENANAWNHIAQNLPYGSHILKIYRDGSNNSTIHLDGIEVKGSTGTAPWKNPSEISFHQPKRPPIPDSACVLADYMVFADFKPQTAAGIGLISKGVRSVSASRDFFINDTGSNTLALDLSVTHKSGFKVSSGSTADSDTTITFRLPSFGVNYVSRGYQHDTRKKLFLDTTDKDSDSTKDNTAGEGSYAHLTSNLDLGVYKFGTNIVSGQYPVFEGFDVVTPTHTSHHYQAFETPFIHELVGGDRNMEQHNLVVSPDGKTWDEVTRNTSYIGKCVLRASAETHNTANSTIVFDDWRGFTAQGQANNDKFNKDFAIGHYNLICLVPGQYRIHLWTYSDTNITAGSGLKIYVNGVVAINSYYADADTHSTSIFVTPQLERGDYISVNGTYRQSNANFEITRV